MNIEFLFESQKIYRKNLIAAVEGLEERTLLQVPVGFSNNIHWNLCHVLATQQLLVYKLSGLDMFFDSQFVEQFKKGSSAKDVQQFFDLKKIEMWMNLTLENMIEDYHSKKFTSFNTYPTSSGIVLNNVEEAILYNHVHEQLHYGYVLALKKLV